MHDPKNQAKTERLEAATDAVLQRIAKVEESVDPAASVASAVKTLRKRLAVLDQSLAQGRHITQLYSLLLLTFICRRRPQD